MSKIKMDIIQKYVQKETRKIRVYGEFTVHTDIGELEILLKDHCNPNLFVQYVVEANKGVSSEFEVFITYFFANRYFEKLKEKYGGEKVK